MLPTCVGLDCSGADRGSTNCRAACSQCRATQHICAPIVCPQTCVIPIVSLISTCARPHCNLHWSVCLAFRRALHFMRSFLPCLAVTFTPSLCSCSCLCPCLCLACLLSLPVLGLPSSLPSVLDHPLVWLFCKYSVFFRQSFAMCP